MTGMSLGIVLIAAFLHAFWNYLAKKSRNKIVFIWWFLLIACLLYAPMLILFAMQISNVSYVVAVRELSIVFSALFGIIWLEEGHRQQRLIGALLIALGVVFIGLSR